MTLLLRAVRMACVALVLCWGVIGCGSATTSKDKMGAGKMSDKMSMDQMGDKMSDKMSDKMDDKMGKDKISKDKMEDKK